MRDAVHRIPLIHLEYVTPLIFLSCMSLLSQQVYHEKHVEKGGLIRGRVTLAGTVPKLFPMEVTKNSDKCGRSKLSPRLSIGKTLGVANTVVYLEGVTEGKQCERARKVRLNQSQCEYSPHVMIVTPGTNLEIVNNDVILHNIHAYDCSNESKSIFNIAQPIKGQCTPIKNSQLTQEGVYEVRCDAGHPWMSAFIIVAPHPYYAVTDADGNYTLSDVPPGKYKLKMWHEGVAVIKTDSENGKVKKYYYEEPYESITEVTVPMGGTSTINLNLTLRETNALSNANQ